VIIREGIIGEGNQGLLEVTVWDGIIKALFDIVMNDKGDNDGAGAQG
jgi:hypothetical protein